MVEKIQTPKFDKKAFFDWWVHKSIGNKAFYKTLEILLRAKQSGTTFDEMIKDFHTITMYGSLNELRGIIFHDDSANAKLLDYVIRNPDSPQATDIRNALDQIFNLEFYVITRGAGKRPSTGIYSSKNDAQFCDGTFDTFSGKKIQELLEQIETGLNGIKGEFGPELLSYLIEDSIQPVLRYVERLEYNALHDIDNKEMKDEIRAQIKAIEEVRSRINKLLKQLEIDKSELLKQAIKNVENKTQETEIVTQLKTKLQGEIK